MPLFEQAQAESILIPLNVCFSVTVITDVSKHSFEEGNCLVILQERSGRWAGLSSAK